MAYMNKYQSDDYRRDELIRIIEHSVEKLTLAELEAHRALCREVDISRVRGFILRYDNKVLY